MINSDNSIVNYVAHTSKYCTNSTMGKNLNHLLYKCNIDIEDLNIMAGKQFVKLCPERWINELLEEIIFNANLIRDFINVRDGYYDLLYERNRKYEHIFVRSEFTSILNDLCTA